MARQSEKEKRFLRAIDAGSAAARLMWIIRRDTTSRFDREDLLFAHFELSYDWAHEENATVDFEIRHAANITLRHDSVAFRIVAARGAPKAEAV